MTESLFLSTPTDDPGILSMILGHEGGVYTNHPNDRGGPTKWGITIPVLSKFRGRPCSANDIFHLTRAEAEQIYLKNFVRPFDGVADPLRANVVDMGVNAGIGRATILLQQTIGVTVDGKIGPATRGATHVRDWHDLYTGIRLAFYEDICRANPDQLVFRKGWRNRALSFYGKDRRLRMPRGDDPVFGFVGKAFSDVF
jgi:lysozyme family protein